MGAPSQIIARLSVIAPLTVGFERAVLVFTGSGIVVTSTAKQSSGLALGKLGQFLVRAFKGGSERQRQLKAQTMAPDDILTGDPHSFQVPYGDVVTLELITRNGRAEDISIITRHEKLVFRISAGSSTERFEESMAGLLGERFKVRRSN